VPAFHDEPVSPELALVDPVLRERLLRESLHELLHERTEALRPLPRETFGPPPTPAPTPAFTAPPARSTPAPGRARRLLPSLLSAGALATLFLALPSLAFLPPRQAPRLDVTEQHPSTLAGPRVTWQADPEADYYVLEVVADGRLVLVAHPASPPVPLDSLAPGDYTWRVFAGYGALADHDTRGPIAGGSLTVAEHAEGRG